MAIADNVKSFSLILIGWPVNTLVHVSFFWWKFVNENSVCTSKNSSKCCYSFMRLSVRVKKVLQYWSLEWQLESSFDRHQLLQNRRRAIGSSRHQSRRQITYQERCRDCWLQLGRRRDKVELERRRGGKRERRKRGGLPEYCFHQRKNWRAHSSRQNLNSWHSSPQPKNYCYKLLKGFLNGFLNFSLIIPNNLCRSMFWLTWFNWQLITFSQTKINLKRAENFWCIIVHQSDFFNP